MKMVHHPNFDKTNRQDQALKKEKKGRGDADDVQGCAKDPAFTPLSLTSRLIKYPLV